MTQNNEWPCCPACGSEDVTIWSDGCMLECNMCKRINGQLDSTCIQGYAQRKKVKGKPELEDYEQSETLRREARLERDLRFLARLNIGLGFLGK